MTVYNLNADNTAFITDNGQSRLDQYASTGTGINITRAEFGRDSVAEGLPVNDESWNDTLDIQYVSTAINVLPVNEHILIVRIAIEDISFNFGHISLYSNDVLLAYLPLPVRFSKIPGLPPYQIEIILEQDNILYKINNVHLPIATHPRISDLPPNPTFTTSYLTYNITDASREIADPKIHRIAYMQNGAWTYKDMPLQVPPTPPLPLTTNSEYYSDSGLPSQGRDANFLSEAKSAYGPQVRATFGIRDDLIQKEGFLYQFPGGGIEILENLPRASILRYGIVRLIDSEHYEDSLNTDVITKEALGIALNNNFATIAEIQQGVTPSKTVGTQNLKEAAQTGFLYNVKYITNDSLTPVITATNTGGGLGYYSTSPTYLDVSQATSALRVLNDPTKGKSLQVEGLSYFDYSGDLTNTVINQTGSGRALDIVGAVRVSCNSANASLDISNTGLGYSVHARSQSYFLSPNGNAAVTFENTSNGYGFHSKSPGLIAAISGSPSLTVTGGQALSVTGTSTFTSSSTTVSITGSGAYYALDVTGQSWFHGSNTLPIVEITNLGSGSAARFISTTSTSSPTVEVTNSGTSFSLQANQWIGIANGILAKPAIAFISDTDTGIARLDENVISLITGGGNRVEISNADTKFHQNVIIDGDLTVNGNYTELNIETVSIEDPIITLNNNETGNGTTVPYSGIEIDRGTATNAQWVWEESTGRWTARGASNVIGGVVIDNSDFALSNGSAGSPSLRFTNSPTTGFFRSASNEIAISIAGTQQVWINTNHIRHSTTSGHSYMSGNTIIATSSSGPSYIDLRSVSGMESAIRFHNSTGTLLRWSVHKSSTAESGSNVGSDFNLLRYNDAGTSLGTVLSITRSSGSINLYGDTRISKNTPYFIADASASGQKAGFVVNTNTSQRWFSGTDATSESGSNAGSNYVIDRYNDAGTYIDTPFIVYRNTGNVSVTNTLSVGVDLNVTGNTTSNGTLNVVGTTTLGVVNISGDTTISKSNPTLIFNSSSVDTRGTRFRTNGVDRWLLYVNSTAEAGSNAGSNFAIRRYDDAGTSLGDVFFIARSNGLASFSNALVVGSTLTTSGNITVNSTSASVNINVPSSGQIAAVYYRVNSLARWGIFSNATAESGSNSGSNFQINRYDDSGNSINYPFAITRSTGMVSIREGLTITGTTTSEALTASGNITVSSSLPEIRINAAASGQNKTLRFMVSNATRWSLVGDNTAESGSNAGSNFQIIRYDDAGASISTPFIINRASGLTAIQNGLTVIGGGTLDTVSVTGTSTLNAVNTSGDITISKASPSIVINSPSPASRAIRFRTNNLERWIAYVNSTAESGSNAGSDFILSRYDDSGAAINTAIAITRSSGLVRVYSTFQADGTSTLGVVNTSGDITISKTTPTLHLNAPAAGSSRIIYWKTNGATRWALYANSTAESGSNSGSDLAINRYDDAGATINSVFSISRATGNATFANNLTVSGTSNLAGLSTSGVLSESYNAQNPASGTTYDVPAGNSHLAITTGGVTLAALTITLPPDPVYGQIFNLSSDCTITSLTVQVAASPAGTALFGAPTTMTPSTPFTWKYLSTANRWVSM